MTARRAYVETPHDRARRARVYLDTPGYYAVTEVKGAVEVGARVTCEPTPDPWFPTNPQDRPHYWSLWVNGSLRAGPAMFPDWTKTGRAITREEYADLVTDRMLCAAIDPDAPESNPTRSVDLASMRSLF